MKKPKKLKPKQVLRNLLDQQMQNSPRVTPECRHFGECGGCEFQDIEYQSQAEAKRGVLIELIAQNDLNTLIPAESIGLTPSPISFGYRQRMDYVFAFDKAGLRKRNSHKWVIDLEECPLLGDKPFQAFHRARNLADERKLSSYNYLSHEGYLRYFVIRRTRRGEILVSLVTKSREFAADIDYIAKTLLSENLATSIHWLLQESISEVSFGESIQHWGTEYITEDYLGKSFYISPNTFFQANPNVAEKAYAQICTHVQNSGAEFIIDTYSGTGIIAQLISSEAKEIIAVENVAENIEIARANLENNRITNVTLITEDAFKYLNSLQRAPEHIIVNPPRIGLGDKACTELLRIAPEVISYMSCNPLTLLTDLKQLATSYKVTECTVYDMFPQTRHWETLVLLQKK